MKHETIKDAKKAVEKSYNSFLLKAGCTDPDAVVASFKRILERGECLNFTTLLFRCRPNVGFKVLKLMTSLGRCRPPSMSQFKASPYWYGPPTSPHYHHAYLSCFSAEVLRCELDQSAKWIPSILKHDPFDKKAILQDEGNLCRDAKRGRHRSGRCADCP